MDKQTVRQVVQSTISENIVRWFVKHEQQWVTYDRQDKPLAVPVQADVKKLMKASKKGMLEEDALTLAYLLWAARGVMRYCWYNSRECDWSTALFSAWKRDGLWLDWDTDRRERREKAEEQARRFENMVLTGSEEHVGPVNKSALARKAKEEREAKAKAEAAAEAEKQARLEEQAKFELAVQQAVQSGLTPPTREEWLASLTVATK